MDGLEIMTMIRKIECERQLLPSYIVSSTQDVSDHVTMILLKAGGNEVVTKPVPADFIPNLAGRLQEETLMTTAKEMMSRIQSNA